MTADERKKVAVDFLRMAGQGHPYEMQSALKPGGIHHNVYFPRGWDALLKAMADAAKKSPMTRHDVKHVICEGDLVVVHSHVVHQPDEPGFAVVHMFRFEGDKIAEMWDVGLSIPANSPNTDGAF